MPEAELNQICIQNPTSLKNLKEENRTGSITTVLSSKPRRCSWGLSLKTQGESEKRHFVPFGVDAYALDLDPGYVGQSVQSSEE